MNFYSFVLYQFANAAFMLDMRSRLAAVIISVKNNPAYTVASSALIKLDNDPIMSAPLTNSPST